jgi:hypothetical protein
MGYPQVFSRRGSRLSTGISQASTRAFFQELIRAIQTKGIFPDRIRAIHTYFEWIWAIHRYFLVEDPGYPQVFPNRIRPGEDPGYPQVFPNRILASRRGSELSADIFQERILAIRRYFLRKDPDYPQVFSRRRSHLSTGIFHMRIWASHRYFSGEDPSCFPGEYPGNTEIFLRAIQTKGIFPERIWAIHRYFEWIWAIQRYFP